MTLEFALVGRCVMFYQHGLCSVSILPGLMLETLIVIPVKTGIHIFQRLTGFPLARERRKAKVLFTKTCQAGDHFDERAKGRLWFASDDSSFLILLVYHNKCNK